MNYIKLARVYLSLSARSAIPLGSPLFLGIFVVAFIVFGPTGMRAADLVFTMRSSPLFAVALWLGWTILVFPVARVALVPPSSLYLRWLPVPRFVLYLSAAFAAFVVELPWIVLFSRGENVFVGLAAGFGALALHAVATVRPYGIPHAFICLGWTISAFTSSPWLTLGLSLSIAGVAVKYALDRAPEVHAVVPGAPRVLHPIWALARVHVAYLVRKEPAVLGRLVVLSSLAGMIIPLAARGFDLETSSDFGRLSLIVASVFLSPGLSGVNAAVIRSERFLAWMTDVLKTPMANRTLGAALASSMVAAFSGFWLGFVALIMGHVSLLVSLRIWAVSVIWGVVLALFGTGLARESEASPKRGDRGMVFALVMMIVGIVSASRWGDITLVFHVIFAILALGASPHRAFRIRRLRGIS